MIRNLPFPPPGSMQRALLAGGFVSTMVLLVPLCLLAVSLIRTTWLDEIDEAAETVRADTRTLLRSRVEETLQYTEFMARQLEERTRTEVKERVEEAHAIATGLFEQFSETLPRQELENLVREALRPIRFDEGRGYYFATGLDGTEQLFADRPALEGENLLDLQDTEGKSVVRDMIRIARTQGEGFYEYRWSKPEVPGQSHRKISYIKYFQPLNWLIGSGLYVDDVEQEIQQEVLARIASMRWGPDGYLLVFRHDGTYLYHPQEEYIGRNMLHLRDPNGIPVNRRLLEIARSGGGYLDYVWNKYSTGERIPKFTYVTTHAPWGWVIGTGAYLDDLAERQEALTRRVNQDTRNAVVAVCALAALSLLVNLLLVQRFRRTLRSQMQPLLAFLDSPPSERPDLDVEAQRFVELKRIAAAALRLDAQWREAQEQLRDRERMQHLLLESTAEGIYGLDKEGRCTFVNRSALTVLGYASEEELLGRSMHQTLLHSAYLIEETAEEHCLVRQSIQDGKPVHVEHGTVCRKNGTRIPVEFWCHPIREADRTVGAVVTFFDITRKLEAEEERRRLERRIQETQKLEAVGTLAGGIAHDFNNILGAILGYSELVKEDVPKGSEQEENIDEVLSATHRAKELVRQILAFSRNEVQKHEVLPAHRVISEALRLLRQTIPSTIVIESSIEERDTLVLGDPTQVHQIMMNLCTNAYHAMGSEGGTLRVDLEAVEVSSELAARTGDLHPGAYVRLSVSDTGEGMDPDTQTRACEPFFSTKGPGKGSGLGLSVVHGIVRSHEGTIRIESERGRGTRVDVYLPRAASRCEDVPRPPLPPAPAPEGTERILVVDDELPLARLTQKALANLGYTAESESSSEKALRRVLENPERFDLLISDQTMPLMTGTTLTRRILDVRPDLPIILCTGYSECLDEEEARAIGAHRLLYKPLDLTLLARTVRDALDCKRTSERHDPTGSGGDF